MALSFSYMLILFIQSSQMRLRYKRYPHKGRQAAYMIASIALAVALSGMIQHPLSTQNFLESCSRKPSGMHYIYSICVL